MKKIKILCHIESDVEYRHFIMNDALKEIFIKCEVILITPPKDYHRFTQHKLNKYYIKKNKIIKIDNSRISTWRKRFHFLNLRKMIKKKNLPLFFVWSFIIGYKATIKFLIFQLPILYQIMIRKIDNSLKITSPKTYWNFISDFKPDILLHPSTFGGYFINDMIMAGKKFNIPSLVIMNSWDNPSLKSTFYANPDLVGVWGMQSKNHSKIYMGLHDKNISIMGCAQFEAHKKKSRISKKNFYLEHNIKLNKKIILYAGSTVSRNEYKQLKKILDFLSKNNLNNSFQLMYRAHPWGFHPNTSEKILSLKDKGLIFEKTSVESYYENSKSTNNKTINLLEYERTNDILKNVEILISPMSTILLEGGIHGIPTMCLFPKEDQSFSLFDKERQTWRVFNKYLPHFREIIDHKYIMFCDSYDLIDESLVNLLSKAKDKHYRKKLQSSMNYFVEMKKRSFSTILYEKVVQLSKM